MATIKAIQTLDIALPTEAGALARVYGAFQESKINVIASWGYEMGPGQAAAHFYVADVDATRDVLKRLGLKATTSNAVWFEAKDQVGAYAELLGKVAKADVNLTATDAIAVNGNFASVLFTDEKDFTKLRTALKI